MTSIPSVSSDFHSQYGNINGDKENNTSNTSNTEKNIKNLSSFLNREIVEEDLFNPPKKPDFNDDRPKSRVIRHIMPQLNTKEMVSLVEEILFSIENDEKLTKLINIWKRLNDHERLVDATSQFQMMLEIGCCHGFVETISELSIKGMNIDKIIDRISEYQLELKKVIRRQIIEIIAVSSKVILKDSLNNAMKKPKAFDEMMQKLSKLFKERSSEVESDLKRIKHPTKEETLIIHGKVKIAIALSKTIKENTELNKKLMDQLSNRFKNYESQIKYIELARRVTFPTSNFKEIQKEQMLPNQVIHLENVEKLLTNHEGQIIATVKLRKEESPEGHVFVFISDHIHGGHVLFDSSDLVSGFHVFNNREELLEGIRSNLESYQQFFSTFIINVNQ